jgi:hypothetical protein
MQQKEESNNTPAGNNAEAAPNQLATNPNPRANENLEGTPIDKNTPTDNTLDVGSEITDGEAS